MKEMVRISGVSFLRTGGLSAYGPQSCWCSQGLVVELDGAVRGRGLESGESRVEQLVRDVEIEGLA